MTARNILRVGATAVPWTVSWTSEEGHCLEVCPFFKKLALSQPSSSGHGKPQFGKLHMNRQREAIAKGLCDLCGKSHATTAKVSLSHARPVAHGAESMAILQVEPLLHRGCAMESIRFCPSLKRDIAEGTIVIRQVTRWRAQCAVMTPEYVESLTGHHRKALGHAKFELLQWVDQDIAWLEKRYA